MIKTPTNTHGLGRIACKAKKYTRFAEALAKAMPEYVVSPPKNQPVGRMATLRLTQNNMVIEWEAVEEKFQEVAKESGVKYMRPWTVA